MPVSPPVLALAWGLTFLGSAIRGTIGMAIALVSVPVLALVDPALVPVPQMLLALVLNGFLFWRDREALDTAGLGWVTCNRATGFLAGIGSGVSHHVAGMGGRRWRSSTTAPPGRPRGAPYRWCSSRAM